MVDLSIAKCERSPEGKPPFSYGFPMVFLWLYHYNPSLPEGIPNVSDTYPLIKIVSKGNHPQIALIQVSELL